MSTVRQRSTASKAEAAANGRPRRVVRPPAAEIVPKPAARHVPDVVTRKKLHEIKAKIAAVKKEAREKMEADREAERRHRAYLSALLAHPAAGDMLDEVYNLLDQTLGTDFDDSRTLVGTLVLVEAMKALREKAAGTS